MKKLLIIMTVLSVLVFSGCGGGGSASTESCNNTLSVNPTSLDANIDVTTSSSSICTSVVLTTGSATITLDGTSQTMVINQVYKVYN
jgi:hypothetical protein